MAHTTPRKQRTRQHVIADLGMHHVEGFILRAGHTAQRVERDYGYDLLLFTYGASGFVEPGFIPIQIKSSEMLQKFGDDFAYDLDVRDYNLWTREKMPVILILYDVSRRKAFWLPVQNYFRDDATRRSKRGARTIRVRIPKRQVVSDRGIARMRELKQSAQLPVVFGGNS